jgi:DNA-binding CsgD family transcriptional regulator
VPALIGRTRECQVLADLVDAVVEGRAQALVVRGDPGIGKTALLQHLVETAPGFMVARATGVESEMDLPFAALHQLCAPMLERVAALPEPQRIAAGTAFGLRVGGPPDRMLIGLAVLNLLSGAAGDGPLLCVVDEAHWIDRESASVLAFVARRLLASRVALVFATRSPVEPMAELPELLVEGLDDIHAQALLDSVVHVPIDERVRDQIVVESAGNPLALIEWPRRLAPIGLAGGFAVPSGAASTSRAEATCLQQVIQLPESTRRFWVVAAAEPTGDPIIIWRAARALGIAPPDAAPAIDAGLIDLGVRVTFRDPLVRASSYGAAALGVRQAAHRALADATDHDLDPDRWAWHRALGSPGPDEEIAEALERSARGTCTRRGLAASAALLERSAALSLVPSRRAARLLASAAAHLDGGSFELAGGLLAAAAATPLDELGRAQLDVLRGRHALFCGHRRAAPALFTSAAVRQQGHDLRLAFATHLEAIGAAASIGSGEENARRDAAQATIACPRSPEPSTLESLALGLAMATLDGPQAAAPLLRHVLATGDDTFGANAFVWLGYAVTAATVLWDSDACSRFSTLQVAVARRAGALSMLPHALDMLARSRAFEGDLDAAACALNEASEILRATGSELIAAASVLHVALQASDHAEQRIDEHIDAARACGDGLSLKAALWARATLGNGRGEYDQALTAASKAIELPCGWSEVSLHEHVEAAVRCGQPDIAASTLERMVASTEASGTDWALGVQRRCRALLAADADADDLYVQAIEHLSRTRLRPELARARLLYGEWLRRTNRRVDARAELQTAYDMFVSMGIRAFAERCRHELLLTGATVRKRTVDSYDELTTQELEVSRLALDGRTNAEIGAQLFISVRTVEWHLRKVFTKLGISSRRELKGVLSTRSSWPSPASADEGLRATRPTRR